MTYTDLLISLNRAYEMLDNAQKYLMSLKDHSEPTSPYLAEQIADQEAYIQTLHKDIEEMEKST